MDLHRGGHVAAAKETYQRLLLEHGDDANLIGLLGVVALQEGRRDEAERLWRRSLGLACAAPVYIRNINNLAATLFEDGRNGEAAQLLDEAAIPPWSGTDAPDERQLESILSLAICLRRVKLMNKARATLEPVGALLPDNKDVQTLLAACRFAEEDFVAALDILQHFAGADDLWTLTARLHCERMLGREAEAEADHRQVLQRASVYIGDDVRADRKTVLVINSGEEMAPGELRLRSSFFWQLSVAAGAGAEGRFQFHLGVRRQRIRQTGRPEAGCRSQQLCQRRAFVS